MKEFRESINEKLEKVEEAIRKYECRSIELEKQRGKLTTVLNTWLGQGIQDDSMADGPPERPSPPVVARPPTPLPIAGVDSMDCPTCGNSIPVRKVFVHMETCFVQVRK